MVNRGSTSNALELDKLKQDKSAAADNEEDGCEQSDEALSTMMSALKFGFGSLLASKELDGDSMSPDDVISDEMLNNIIDRSRGLHATASSQQLQTITASGMQQMSSDEQASSEGPAQLLQSVEQDAASFRKDMSLPMTSLRCLAGEHIPKTDGGGDDGLSSDLANPSNLRDIASQWMQVKSKRVRKTRVETVRVKNVGEVSVLKINDYSIEGGEPSVYDREIKGKVDSEWGRVQKRKGGVSMLFNMPRCNLMLLLKITEHQDICQHCWDGGTLMCCTSCPASYHPKCVGMSRVVSYQWRCPHHQGCITCGKSNSAMGFSFRCEVCSHAYCEDCLPTEAEIMGGCSRWEAIGFNAPSNCCFIQCSKSCSEYIAYINGGESK
jgi:hypothetical protein